MPKTPQHRVDELKTSGLKATLPRLRVLKAFEQASHRHLSAEDVYKQLLSEGADVGLATVYRVLAQFAQAGLLTRSQLGADHAVFELNEGDHHDHLVCLHCGRVEEFFDPEIENIQRRVAQERGFELREHSLALYGRCNNPDCQPDDTTVAP